MVLEYHPDADMLDIKFGDGVSAESAEVASGVVLEFDERGRVLGIELEDASGFIDLSRLEVSALPISDLIVSRDVPAKA